MGEWGLGEATIGRVEVRLGWHVITPIKLAEVILIVDVCSGIPLGRYSASRVKKERCDYTKVRRAIFIRFSSSKILTFSLIHLRTHSDLRGQVGVHGNIQCRSASRGWA
jgi:hypothetical protein